jgi:hypothetical protein
VYVLVIDEYLARFYGALVLSYGTVVYGNSNLNSSFVPSNYNQNLTTALFGMGSIKFNDTLLQFDFESASTNSSNI